MAQSPRQSNLFSAEDYQNIYRSFKDVDFRAYDFDSLKASMVEYVNRNYPEDFNDYIESSEFIAIIELLSYLGTSLAFRSDLNTRENLMDTADRRESVVRLAQMLNYQPSRNLASNGMFKLSAVETTESVTDSLGKNLANTTVFWNDPNNMDSYDQFTNILNSAFTASSPFGKPVKRGTVGGINTDLYKLENVKNLQVAYPIQVVVNGEQMAFNIANVDFEDGGTFTERHPDPSEGFHMAYRNDGQGFASPNTGFFVHFRQGELINYDFAYQFPEESRVEAISATNVNETDVYVQEIDDDGNIVDKWTKVQYSRGNENVVYNSIDGNERTIYSVVSGADDSISIQYPDGNFGEVPTGIMRVWGRSSANRKLVVRPDEATDLEITIPYIGTNSQTYYLRLVFGLEETNNNSAPSETNDDVKVRAPQVYYTQDRMVNNKDYNVFPLSRGNEIVKMRTINRTHSGHSRYISLNDPTGFHQSLLISASDGSLYKDDQIPSTEIGYDPAVDTANYITTTGVETLVRGRELSNFFYDEYITDFKNYMSGLWNDAAGYVKDNVFLVDVDVSWTTVTGAQSDNVGFLKMSDGSNRYISPRFDNRDYGFDKYLEEGSVIKFAEFSGSKDYITATVSGISTGTGDSDLDGKQLFVNANVPNGWGIEEILPPFRTTFTEDERRRINAEVSATRNFGLEYVVDTTIDGSNTLGWKVTPNSTQDFSISNGSEITRWVLRAIYEVNNITNLRYDISTRGTRYVFESESDVRFYFDSENQKNFSSDQLVSSIDEVVISGSNNDIDTNEKWVLIDDNTGARRWRMTEGSNLTYPDEFILLGSRSASESNVIATLTIPGDGIYDVSGNILNGVLYLASFSSFDITNSSTYGSIVAGSVIELTSTSNAAKLEKDYVLNTFKPYFEASGYLNTAKIEVIPADINNDGIPDDPFLFKNVVGENDLVFHETVLDANGDDYTRLWTTVWKDVRSEIPVLDNGTVYDSITYTDIIDSGLFLTKDIYYSELQKTMESATMTYLLLGNTNTEVLQTGYESEVFREARDPDTGSILTDSTGNFIPMVTITVNTAVLESMRTEASRRIAKREDDGLPPFTYDTAREESFDYLSSANRTVYIYTNDTSHEVANGRSFTLDSGSATQESFDYKWRHFSPSNNRIDPSVSNIMDMIVLTQTYNDDVQQWKIDGKTLKEFPTPPTTEELRANFSDLDDFKMMSDEIVFGPSEFKVIFGQQAKPELRAKFKVVKVPSTALTNNEIKSRIVELVDEFFMITNWDFGETFYFTELAAYIHTNMAGIVGSVVLVPESKESQFGNLFQVKAESNELFISTAQVNDIIIVDTLTETNMRL